MVEVELKEILDELDERRGGRIGETYNKLSELMADQRRAEEYVTQTTLYLGELDVMLEKWTQKTGIDCDHIEERMEKLKEMI